jgi:membrane-anchored glycerophosphoryl diester phosphodiesterase (GDPDase)
MNKLIRSFRSDYVEDALIVTLVISIVLGLYLAAVFLVILT